MTVILTAATHGSIIMAADSAVTNEFQDTREHETGRKSSYYPGVGCVTTWALASTTR
jgi:hypothetical protein